MDDFENTPINWDDLANWGGHVHIAANGSWVGAEVAS